MILLIIDTTFIKSYDLFNKTGNIREIKKIIFSVSVFVCLLLQYIILRLAQNFVTDTRLKQKINLKKSTNIIKLAFLLILCQLFFLNYQVFFLNYYNSIVLIFIISTTYGISAILLGKVSFVIYFVVQNKSRFRNVIVFYFHRTITCQLYTNCYHGTSVTNL